MIPLAAKLSMSAVLSALAVFLYFYLGGTYRKQCMLAMLLSSCGDAFMVDNFIKIGDFGTYIGAAFFIAAHIVYARCFSAMTRADGRSERNVGLFVGIGFMVVTAAALSVLSFVIPEQPKTLMFFMILVYVAVIGYHLCCNFAYGYGAKKAGIVLAFAVVVFYVSDIFIFVDMLDVTHALRDYVWLLYPVAQLLLITFNSPLKKTAQIA